MIRHERSSTPPHERTLWCTPRALFDRYDKLFSFNFDACALPQSSLCEAFACPPDVYDEITGDDKLSHKYVYQGQDLLRCFRDGLAVDWGSRTWLNPPYGRTIGRWLARARAQADQGRLVVALIPVDTSTRWWQENVQGIADVHYLRSRVRFQGSTGSLNFASAIAIYWPAGTWDGHR